jgi:Protein of unknown function (DUF1800)
MRPSNAVTEELEPADAWKPWQPSPEEPWSRKWAAHLYRRAAFGYSREELIEAEHLGLQGTLDLLFEGRPDATEARETLIDVGRLAAERDDGGNQLRGWWLYCMLHGGHPLREKLTLFWHDHFATSLVKVQNPVLMFRQNCLLREHALGRFGLMLQAISRDGAMLVWLDSNSNVKGRPNENYARELMELFSLGVGHYTEKDVREAARAFTGWRTDGAQFAFNAGLHDSGPKTFLGQTGDWDGGDVVRIVLEQPAAARFLVRKLYRFFVSETIAPSEPLLEPLCESFRKSDYDIAALLRTILSSRHFYSSHAFRQRVKGPVEFVLGAVQTVWRRYAEDDPDYRPLPQQMLVGVLAGSGQALFAPPNVKGWPGGKAWLNTATLLERANFAQSLAMGTIWESRSPQPSKTNDGYLFTLRQVVGAIVPGLFPVEVAAEPSPPRAFDPARILEEERVSCPEDVVRVLLDLYLPGGIASETRSKLVAFIGQGRPEKQDLERRVREAVHAILSLAEYQLC